MTDPQSPQSPDSWESFGHNSVDYNPKFVTSTDFESRDDALAWANNIAFENGFALVKANNGSKNRSEKGLLASYFRCKRHGRPPPTDDPEKQRRSTKCSCLFRIRAVQNYVVKNDQKTVVWNIVTSEGRGVHNHDVAVYKDGDRHFAGLDDEEKEYVRQQTMAGVLPRDIKSGLHQKTPEKPQPSSTQIYNQTRKVRKGVRGERNTAQQMMALAVEAKYVHWHESDPVTHEISHIFMVHPESVKLFRAYHYVVIMDSTYNTNPYKNPVIEIVGVTPTGSSFLIEVAMLPTEFEESYIWLLNKLVDILDCMGTSPSVFVTDRELGLINALKAVYPEVDHLLCRWHVNKAINAKALSLCGTESFKCYVITNDENGWNTVIDAPTEQEFQRAWAVFSRKWRLLADYVGNTWGDHAGKFVLCYTNEVFHLGNTATSHVESAHSLLKSWLKSSHLTLDTMWSRIHDMLEGQHSKIRQELEDSRSRPKITCRTFSLLNGFVSTKAIEIMQQELLRGLGLGIGLEDRCGHVLRTTHGLPCAHNLVSLKNRGRRVHLEDIHVFWKTLVYDSPEQMPKNDLDLLEQLVDDLRNGDPVYRRAVIDLLCDFQHPEDNDLLPPPINEHPKGRPRGSTTRNKSGFEHIQKKFGSPSTKGSTNAQQRLGDFPSGAVGAPLERNYTIGLISSWSKRYGLPEVLWVHFDGWVDVGDDGHCGFRVISHAQRGQEGDYTIMREWCSREMRSDDIYKHLFGTFPSSITGLTGYEVSLRQVAFYRQISCGVDHWMHCDHLLVFATLFNWTICVIGHLRGPNGEKVWYGSCSTIMPLKTSIEGRRPHGIVWIVLYHSHWMRLHSSGLPESVPMPPLNPGWVTYRDQSVAHLDTLYERNIDNWQVYMRSTPGIRHRRDHVDPPVVVSVDST